MNIVVLGLSITSSWGNGHATTWRALLRYFAARGHSVQFLERDVPWYAENRDLPHCSWAEIHLYETLNELRGKYEAAVRDADAVIVGSYVPDGITVGEWVIATAQGTTGFYDIDTPVTLEALERDDCRYLSPELVSQYDIYLSFTGGPVLQQLEQRWGSPCARALYCSVDPDVYFPVPCKPRWDLGYLGTYSPDRQPALERLLLKAAPHCPQTRFVVAGSQYPDGIVWPSNVQRIDHLAPPDHCAFYNAQRFTLNLTRTAMRQAGWSPSVRLFEAAACGTPIISDPWPGLEDFFRPDKEILIAESAAQVLQLLRILPVEDAQRIGKAARARVLRHHTSATRAAEFERALLAVRPAHAISTSSAA